MLTTSVLALGTISCPLMSHCPMYTATPLLLTIHEQAKGCCIVSGMRKCLKRVRPELICYIPRSSLGWLLS